MSATEFAKQYMEQEPWRFQHLMDPFELQRFQAVSEERLGQTENLLRKEIERQIDMEHRRMLASVFGLDSAIDKRKKLLLLEVTP